MTKHKLKVALDLTPAGAHVKSLEISLSSDKREVTAFAVVNDEVAGHASQPVPSI